MQLHLQRHLGIGTHPFAYFSLFASENMWLAQVIRTLRPSRASHPKMRQTTAIRHFLTVLCPQPTPRA